MSLTVNWKLAVGAGIFASLLSVISGVVGRVGLGTLLLRAPLAGLLFAAFILGIELVVRRFLPELLSTDEASGLGSQVDIVVEGEEGDVLPQESSSSGRAASESLESEGGEGAREQDSSADDDWDEQENLEESLVQEVQEVRRDEVEPEPSSEQSESPEAVAGMEGSDAAQPDELDELPDVAKFAEDFASNDSAGLVGGVGDSRTDSGSGDGKDPAMIARALQTMLKRDAEA